MSSIRFRIFLLATVALTAMSIAFVLQYTQIKEKIHATESTIQTLIKIQSLSDLIHPIQKERGLTAGHLIGQDMVLYTLFLRQHKATEALWHNSETSKVLSEHAFYQNFSSRLDDMRERIESRDVDWIEVKKFYSSVVRQLLEMMILKIASLNYFPEVSPELQSLTYFSTARENLGLIRAIINRSSQRGFMNNDELLQISGYLQVFNENIRVFEVLTQSYPSPTTGLLWSKNRHSEVFKSVNRQIHTTLNSQGKKLPEAANIWWNESTQVIDNMKVMENTLIQQINRQMQKKLSYLTNYLFWYGILAALLFILVTLLTTLTVLRILKALSILIHSLDHVEKTQNFGLRIYSNSKDECGKLTLSINNLLSYTDRIIKEKDFLAATDLLTGVMNRRSFIEQAEKEIIRSEAQQTELCLIFCDIDFFKSINDSFGHSVGDKALKAFSQLLRDNLRSQDFIGRWGGEEFIILTPQTDLSIAEQISEQLRRKIMEFTFQPLKQLTTSFGVAQKLPGENFEQLCERADQALYKAKKRGRNQVCSADN